MNIFIFLALALPYTRHTHTHILTYPIHGLTLERFLGANSHGWSCENVGYGEGSAPGVRRYIHL